MQRHALYNLLYVKIVNFAVNDARNHIIRKEMDVILQISLSWYRKSQYQSSTFNWFQKRKDALYTDNLGSFHSMGLEASQISVKVSPVRMTCSSSAGVSLGGSETLNSAVTAPASFKIRTCWRINCYQLFTNKTPHPVLCFCSALVQYIHYLRCWSRWE